MDCTLVRKMATFLQRFDCSVVLWGYLTIGSLLCFWFAHCLLSFECFCLMSFSKIAMRMSLTNNSLAIRKLVALGFQMELELRK